MLQKSRSDQKLNFFSSKRLISYIASAERLPPVVLLTVSCLGLRLDSLLYSSCHSLATQSCEGGERSQLLHPASIIFGGVGLWIFDSSVFLEQFLKSNCGTPTRGINTPVAPPGISILPAITATCLTEAALAVVDTEAISALPLKHRPRSTC